MADSPAPSATDAPAADRAQEAARHLPLLGACGCGPSCGCGCQSGGPCSCSGRCG